MRNADAVEHTLSISGAGIDVDLPAGGSASFTAPTKPGSYVLSCGFHPAMHGVLVVVA